MNSSQNYWNEDSRQIIVSSKYSNNDFAWTHLKSKLNIAKQNFSRIKQLKEESEFSHTLATFTR